MDPSSNSSRAIVFTTAVISTLCGALYLLGLVVNLAIGGSTHSNAPQMQMISAVIALLWNQVLVILFIALRWQTLENRKIYAELAAAFMLLLSALSSLNWFVRLIVIPNLPQDTNPALLALLDPYSSGSIMFAAEHLGWGLFYALAALFAAFAVQGGRFGGWLRGLWLAGSSLAFLHLVGLVVSNPALTFLGFVAWALLLPTTTLLLAVRFRHPIEPI